MVRPNCSDKILGRIKMRYECPWCGHEDIYYVAKYDQPTCINCGRNISKK